MFTVSMTKKQKECFESIFSTMESFYRNDLETLCIVIGRHYKIPDESVKNAAAIVKSLPQGVTFPVPQKADALKAIHQRWLDGGLTQKDERWIFRMDDTERRLLAHVSDVYSRLLMGQLNMIFEELDIGLPDNPHLLDFWNDARWNGAGGMLEVRNLLFPEIKDFGWNGGFGISNPKEFNESLENVAANILYDDEEIEIAGVGPNGDGNYVRFEGRVSEIPDELKNETVRFITSAGQADSPFTLRLECDF